jgi:hypothetical protein
VFDNEEMSIDLPFLQSHDIDHNGNIEIPDVFRAKDFSEEMLYAYDTGLELGFPIGIKGFENKFSWRMSDLNVWTGYMNEGKSVFVLFCMMVASYLYKWKWLIYSPENMPQFTFWMTYAHMLLGKSLDKRWDKRPSKSDLRAASNWLSKYFIVYDPATGCDMDDLIRTITTASRRYKVNGSLIDPWNQVIHDQEQNEREDQYISRRMSDLKRLSLRHNIITNVVAHQVTTRINKTSGNLEKPNIMHIAGGAMFGNKADNVISVYRPYRFSDPSDTSVIVGIDKVKRKALTGLGGDVSIRYDLKSNRYYHLETDATTGDGRKVTALDNLIL